MLLVLHWALSNCCDSLENSFHTFVIKIHMHIIYPFAMLIWEVSIKYHPSIPQNNCSINCVGLSLVVIKKGRGMGYQKNMDTWRSRYWKKIYRHMKVHEKNKKIAMLSKEFIQRERDHTKGVSISSTTIHTLAHLDLIVWFVFLFGSSFWLCNICDTSMPYPSYPTLSSKYSHH